MIDHKQEVYNYFSGNPQVILVLDSICDLGRITLEDIYQLFECNLTPSFRLLLLSFKGGLISDHIPSDSVFLQMYEALFEEKHSGANRLAR